MSSTTILKSFLFLGASGGVGLAALRRALSAGHACTAICRTPSKLTTIFPAASHPNLTVVQGNAHDESVVRRGLINPSNPALMVDAVLSSIGMGWDWSKVGFDDPHVCENGTRTLLSALAALRKEGISGRPKIIVVSTTGISRHGRDTPRAIIPFYALMGTPHADKRIMEDLIAASGEVFTIVRCSFFVDGAGKDGKKSVRVGIEDPDKGHEVLATGYTITRNDAGNWIYEEVLGGQGGQFEGKAVSITT